MTAPLHLTDDERMLWSNTRDLHPLLQKLSDARAALEGARDTITRMAADAGVGFPCSVIDDIDAALATPTPVAVPARDTRDPVHGVIHGEPQHLEKIAEGIMRLPKSDSLDHLLDAPDPVQAASQAAYADAKRIARSHLHGPAVNGCSRTCGGCRVARDIAAAIESAAVRVTAAGRAETAKGGGK